jgi:hypothetical protein
MGCTQYSRAKLFHRRLCLIRGARVTLYVMSERLYSKFYSPRQEKAGHGPGTEYSACLRKSSYSSEYMNDAIAISLEEEDRRVISRNQHRVI